MFIMDINDPIFLEAVNALDTGDVEKLSELIYRQPNLVRDRLLTPNEPGYFKDPYLIWFVADNPIRHSKLPVNVIDITRFLIDAVKHEAPETFDEQINYMLGLVATGRVLHECGVQLAMMDALIDAGASPGSAMGAIAHGNMDAANHLIDRGGDLTLASAMLLDRKGDIDRLVTAADNGEKLIALTAAAFYGRAELVKYLLGIGVDPNNYPPDDSGFHSHATPLHQAVASMSFNTVKLLCEAGARLDMTDTMFAGTPLDWATHMHTATSNATEKAAYARIKAYLKQL
jgi:ankyrin repeat protein